MEPSGPAAVSWETRRAVRRHIDAPATLGLNRSAGPGPQPRKMRELIGTARRLLLGCSQVRRRPTVSDTGARPSTPRTRAAPGLRSITRPRTYGPRSLMRTVAERPLRLL